MICVETFKSREAAGEKQRLLREKGIEARVLVDPLEGRYPALATYQDVVLMVRQESLAEARQVLQQHFKKVS